MFPTIRGVSVQFTGFGPVWSCLTLCSSLQACNGCNGVLFSQVGYFFFLFFKAWLIVVGIFLPSSSCNVCGETYKFAHLNARPFSLLQCGCKTKGGHLKRTNIKLQSVLCGTSFDI